MKIILKDEVDNLGLAGDVVDVADGYGRNYLIPRGLAIPATRGALKEAETLTRARKAREAQTLDVARQHKQTLESRRLRVEARVDEGGTLYGSVGAGDIQEVLRQRGHEVEQRRIELPRPIKSIGEYTVTVHVHPQLSAELPIEVVDVEGKVTAATLAGEPETEAERRAAFEEEVLEAAEEVEAEEELEAGDEEPSDEPMTAAEALAARATAPSDVDAPARPEDLSDDDDEGSAG